MPVCKNEEHFNRRYSECGGCVADLIEEKEKMRLLLVRCHDALRQALPKDELTLDLACFLEIQARYSNEPMASASVGAPKCMQCGSVEYPKIKEGQCFDVYACASRQREL